MKLKPFNIIEILFAIIFITANLLKPMHIPFLGLISTLSISTLSMMYFYAGIYSPKSPGSVKRDLTGYGVIFSVACIALLFSFQHWPFGFIYLIIGISLFLLAVVIRVIAVYLFKNKELLKFNKGIAIRYGILLITMLYALLSLKLK